MVARSPPKFQQKKMAAPPPPPLDPVLLRETVNKVDKAIARLQELQFTVTGGEKVISGVTLSPRSTRIYLRTSLRCKQETLRMKNANARRSPPGKLPTDTGDWRRMSLPAMLLGETMGEILQASKFARQMVEAVDPKPKKTCDDPKTPVTQRRDQRPNPEKSELPARRKREKQVALQTIRSDSNPISLQRAKSRINFKVSPLHKSECDKENCRYIANRVSPRNKPWVKKTVLFPNPLFHSSPTSKRQKFCRTKSPVIARNRQTPHKFLIKSPPSASKFGVKIRSPPLSISPTRSTVLRKRSPPKVSAAAMLRRSFSPSRLATKLVSPLKSRKSAPNYNEIKMVISGVKQISPPKASAAMRRPFSPSRLATKLVSPLKSRKSAPNYNEIKMVISGVKQISPPKASAAMRRSFSPSRLATKLVSPLKSRKSANQIDGAKMMISGLRQRPSTMQMGIAAPRI